MNVEWLTSISQPATFDFLLNTGTEIFLASIFKHPTTGAWSASILGHAVQPNSEECNFMHALEDVTMYMQENGLLTKVGVELRQSLGVPFKLRQCLTWSRVLCILYSRMIEFPLIHII